MIDQEGNEQQLVGEVGFTVLPDGNGEFAITVTPRWPQPTSALPVGRWTMRRPDTNVGVILTIAPRGPSA